MRGIDSEGHVANFVETEQIAIHDTMRASFVQVCVCVRVRVCAWVCVYIYVYMCVLHKCVCILVHKQMYWIRTNLQRFQSSNVIWNIRMLIFHYILVI